MSSSDRNAGTERQESNVTDTTAASAQLYDKIGKLNLSNGEDSSTVKTSNQNKFEG